MKTEVSKIEFNGKSYIMLFAVKKKGLRYYSLVRFIKGNTILKALEHQAELLAIFSEHYKEFNKSFKKPKIDNIDLLEAERIYKEK